MNAHDTYGTRRRPQRDAGVLPHPLPRPPIDSRVRVWGHGLLLLMLGVTAYANSLSAPFVFDDHGSIVDNPFVRRLWPLTDAWSAPLQSAMAGRPVISLSLALDYALTGSLAPAGFRAWNLAVHLLAALVLFGLVRRTLLTARSTVTDASALWLAWITAAIWLLHPLNSEVVDYITQRTESTMGLCYLLTVYAAARAMAARAPGRRWPALAIAACAIGMASKESMVTAPMMVLLYDRAFWSGSLRQALRARWPMYAGLATTWVILGALTVGGPRSHSAGFSAGVDMWTYLSNQPAMVLQYLKLAVWPVGLILDYGTPRELAFSELWPSTAIVVGVLVATLVAWGRQPALAFLGTWFFVTLAPSSSLVPIATEVGAERRMYLPLAALAAGAVMLAHGLLTPRLANRTPLVRATVMIGIVAAACTGLSALTLLRNREYQSPSGIWQTVVDRRPHGRAHYNLAMELVEQGARDQALRHYRLALTDEPAAHYAVGFELAAEGHYDEASAHYREFIRLRPDDVNVVRAYVLLGRAQKSQGHFTAAVDALQEALRRHPANLDARIELADVLFKSERFGDALDAYRQLTRLAPNNPTGHSGMGIALVALGRDRDAIDAFARAVTLQPGDASARYNLANALAGNGRLDAAIAEYRQALLLVPASSRYHNALGLTLAARGHTDEALAEFHRSLSIDPTDPESRQYLAAVLAHPALSERRHDTALR